MEKITYTNYTIQTDLEICKQQAIQEIENLINKYRGNYVEPNQIIEEVRKSINNKNSVIEIKEYLLDKSALIKKRNTEIIKQTLIYIGLKNKYYKFKKNSFIQPFTYIHIDHPIWNEVSRPSNNCYLKYVFVGQEFVAFDDFGDGKMPYYNTHNFINKLRIEINEPRDNQNKCPICGYECENCDCRNNCDFCEKRNNDVSTCVCQKELTEVLKEEGKESLTL